MTSLPPLRHLRVAFLASLVAALLVSTLACAGRRGGSSASAEDKQSFEYQGRTRSYVVRAPAGITRTSAPLPVVFVLHGGGGNAGNAEQMTGFTRLVERERIIVVYPEGTGRFRNRLLTWNAQHCCGPAMTERVDDVGFISALIDTLAAHYPVDQRRVYATGMSNGGMMSHRLGRELSARITAVAPVVGAVFGDEAPPARPVSALMINGLLDKAVPAQGGNSGGRGASAWDGMPAKPNIDQGTYWARYNACDATPRLNERGSVLHWTYRCPAGRAVELYQLMDNGHAWPGGKSGSRLGDTPSTAIDGTEVIWAFFKPLSR